MSLFRSNFWGTQATCDVLFPILRKGARVVFVGDAISKVPGLDLRGQLTCESLTRADLNEIVELAYLEDVRNHCHEAKGWPVSPFSASMVFLSALARIMQREVCIDLLID